jgi:hypothetical protein
MNGANHRHGWEAPYCQSNRERLSLALISWKANACLASWRIRAGRRGKCDWRP